MASNTFILCFFALILYHVSDAATVPASAGNGYYKAAVYEHAVILPAKLAESYDEAVTQMMLNLNVFKKQADIAGGQGVDIIVFPEVGIYGYGFKEPPQIAPYLEYIPDPEETDWIPCDNPERFNRAKVQTFLSCLAKNNSFYLVANYGDAQPCKSTDPNCPANGQYQYNTNVVYNRNGKLIARYHKEHLYYETQFQEPATPERVTFDTEFGKFGTFICFDILFYEPAIPLVEQYGITDVVFPTAWMDALPYFSAIGFHSAFVPAYNVNFLSANLHLPSNRFQGSGIFTPAGPITYYYDRNSVDGALLVADVPILDRARKVSRIKFKFGNSELRFLREPDFQSKVRKNWYNFVSLTSSRGNMTVCQKNLCCFLSFEKNNSAGNYAFGVFYGQHKNKSYNLQMCILLQCASDNNLDCGKDIYSADGYFNSFVIRGNFSTPYVTPQVIRSNNGSLELPPLGTMKYDSNGLAGDAMTNPLLHTTLVGRLYDELATDQTSASTASYRVLNIYVFLQLFAAFLSFFVI